MKMRANISTLPDRNARHVEQRRILTKMYQRGTRFIYATGRYYIGFPSEAAMNRSRRRLEKKEGRTGDACYVNGALNASGNGDNLHWFLR